MDKYVVVFGVENFVGWALAKRLARFGYKVVCPIDSKFEGKAFLNYCAANYIYTVKLDFDKPLAVCKAVKDINPRQIFYFSAYGQRSGDDFSLIKYFQVDLPKKIIEECLDDDNARFIYQGSSASTNYFNSAHCPYKEAKDLAVKVLLQDSSQKDKSVCILRPTHLYGPDMYSSSALIDFCYKAFVESFIFTESIIFNQDFLHIRDFINLAILVSGAPQLGSSIINCRSGEVLTGGIALQAVRPFLPNVFLQDAAGVLSKKPTFNARDTVLLDSDFINWKPVVPLTKGLPEFFEWILGSCIYLALPGQDAKVISDLRDAYALKNSCPIERFF